MKKSILVRSTLLAAVAAFSGVSEATAQGAPADGPRHLRYLNPPTNPKNPSFTQAIEATHAWPHPLHLRAAGPRRERQAGRRAGRFSRPGALYEVEAVAVLPPA